MIYRGHNARDGENIRNAFDNTREGKKTLLLKLSWHKKRNNKFVDVINRNYFETCLRLVNC